MTWTLMTRPLRGFAVLVAAFLVSFAAIAAAQAQQRPVMTDLSITQNAITLAFDQPVSMQILHLADPARIVLEMQETGFAFDSAAVPLPETVVSARMGRFDKGLTRIVLQLAVPLVADFTGDAAGGGALEGRQSFELSLTARDETAFAAHAEADAEAYGAGRAIIAGQGDEPAQAGAAKPFTLVIDPGHGGIDSGALGALGTLEKDMTLAFATKLRNALAGAPDVRIILTREDDAFVSLRDRVAIARNAAADLFLSIHADSIKLPELRGATVYTLSDSASDAVSAALAEQENLADQIAGIPPVQEDPDVNSILVDLLKRETTTFSHAIANEIVIGLKSGGINLIKNPVRSAGFRVLTAPDVPSVLLEMGYLSNVEDERLMKDEAWRLRKAAILADTIKAYAAAHNSAASKP
jgi:N-acetylmuramoyl-L-alanine amidase